MKNLIATMFMFWMFTISTSFAATLTFSESFDEVSVTPFAHSASETIKEDIIFNTNTMDKSYASYLMSNSDAKLMVKNLNMSTEPTILSRCPLNERDTVLHTGKANMTTLGISKWYSMAGLMYDFDSLNDSLAISFSYLNTRPVTSGKVVVVLQEVDHNDLVLWEKTFTCAGWSTLYKGWRELNFTKERMASVLAGKKFNRLWLVEAELYLDKVGGGFFDNVAFTVTNSDPEPTIPPSTEEDRALPPVPPVTPVDNTTVTDGLVNDATTTVEIMCPCKNGWKNHGEYVSCVAKAKTALQARYHGSIIEKVMPNAAQSNCGNGGNGGNGNGNNK